jgi:hypothetical protein
LPVRTVAELSWKAHVAAPVPTSSVPLGGAGENVLVTHTVVPAFEIGSGRPNRQPTSVQSTPAGVDPAGVGPMLHVVPMQPESVKRFVAPLGVALSGTADLPPPSERLPQARFFSGIVPPRSLYVVPQLPAAGVERKSKREGGTVVVVLDDDVEVDDDGPLVEVEPRLVEVVEPRVVVLVEPRVVVLDVPVVEVVDELAVVVDVGGLELVVLLLELDVLVLPPIVVVVGGLHSWVSRTRSDLTSRA